MTNKILKFYDNHFDNSYSLISEKIYIDKNFLISNWNIIKINFYNKNNFKKIDNFYSVFKNLNELNDEYNFKEKKEFNEKFENFRNIINHFYNEKESFYKEKKEKIINEIKSCKSKIDDLTNSNISWQDKKIKLNNQIKKRKKISKWKNFLIKILTFNFYDKNKNIQSKINQIKMDINILQNDITKQENQKWWLERGLKQNIRKNEILEKEINTINESLENIDSHLMQTWEILNEKKTNKEKINDKSLPPIIALKIEVNSMNLKNLQPSTSSTKSNSLKI